MQCRSTERGGGILNQTTTTAYAEKRTKIRKNLNAHDQSQDTLKSPNDSSSNEIVMVAAQRLRSCNGLGLKRLQCEICSGHLVLHGEVRSYYLKQLAQEILRSLNGIHRIVNELEVVYASTEKYEDDKSQGDAQ